MIYFMVNEYALFKKSYTFGYFYRIIYEQQ